jgi:two-component system LytT family response regulator
MKKDLKVLVADDESLARRRLSRLLEAMPDVTVAGECETGEEVLAAVAKEEVDVVLLDIQMPGLTGLEAKGLLGEEGPVVIFTTAHPEHALEAFEVGAVDYVLKPIEPARLAKALERARGLVENTPHLDRLPLVSAGEVRLVDPELVTHALFDGHLVTVHLESEAILTDLSLQDLERRLPRLERVHRRALLNLACVERLKPQPSGGYVALTRSGKEVPISRQSARKLRRLLGV